MTSVANFDRKVTARIHRWPAGMRPVMSTVSYIGEPSVVLTMGAAGFIAALERSQSTVVRAFIWAAVAYGFNTILKLLLRRRRPHNLNVTTLGVRSYSFPSGHAFGSVIFYGLFAYLDFKYLAHPINYLLGFLLLILIGLIGCSRIYLNAHYPSDVIGGWALGLVSLLLITGLVF